MKRFLNSGLFGVAVLCFFLPFFNIKCNNTKIVTVSGVQMATGTRINPAGGGMFDRIGDTGSSSKESKEMFEIPVLLALLTVLAGAIVTLVLAQKGRDRKNSQWAIYLSAGTLLLLLAEAVSLMIQMSDLDKEATQLSGMITWHFDIGYWLVVLISIGTVVYNVMELKKINAIPVTDENGFIAPPTNMNV
jgi:hypothetical protein